MADPARESPAAAPDFLIIGAMKSGTTTLYRWLSEQPEVWLPDTKEPDYFSSGWERGDASYRALFAAAPREAVTGEASVSYTSARHGAAAAERIAATLPTAALIFLAREPTDRLRSHYRHEVQRGRETRPLGVALAEEGSAYVTSSEYSARLTPYLSGPLRSNLCVVRFEDLVAPPHPAWDAVCDRLGLPRRPAPATAHNVTADKRQYGPLLARLWRTPLVQKAGRAPAPVRRVARSLLTRDDDRYRALLRSASDPLPPEVVARLALDAERLANALERPPLWASLTGSLSGG